MSGVIYLKIQNRFRKFSQGGAAAIAGASVVSGLVVGSVACAQSRALEDDPDGPPRDWRCGRGNWGWGRILGLWLKSHGRCQAQRDVVFCRTLCEECISFLHPNLMEGVPARASPVLW